MREPYFKIGETCVLVSVNYPELNGEYVIQNITSAEEANMLYSHLFSEDYNGPFVYDIGVLAGDTECPWWEEQALRKKYPPSTLSFNELITECKSNVVY